VALILSLIAVLGETRLLSFVVSGIEEGSLEDWLAGFVNWKLGGIVAALAAALLWYALGQWVLRVEHPDESNRRPIWAVLGAIPAVAALIGVVKLPAPTDGSWLAYLFLIYSPLLCYYIGTVFFSPPSYRDTPPGAGALRGLVRQ
jgi:hypothetical protein